MRNVSIISLAFLLVCSTTVEGQVQPKRPVDPNISLGFGATTSWSNKPHNGIDYVATLGTDIKSIGPGGLISPATYTKTNAARFGSIMPSGLGPAIWMKYTLATGEPVYVLYGHTATRWADKSSGVGTPDFVFDVTYEIDWRAGSAIDADVIVGQTAPFYNTRQLRPHLHISVFKPKKVCNNAYCEPPAVGWGYSDIHLATGDYIDPEKFFSLPEYELLNLVATRTLPVNPIVSASDQPIDLSGTGFACPDPTDATRCLSVELTRDGQLVQILRAPDRVQRVVATSLRLQVNIQIAGSYKVQVINPDGSRSNKLTFKVAKAAFKPFYDRSLDPAFATSVFSSLKVDSRGHVRVARRIGCALGASVLRVHAISRNGVYDWESPNLTSCGASSLTTGGVHIGRNDQVFVTDITTLSSFNSNGSVPTGTDWPLKLAPESNWAFATFRGTEFPHFELISDAATGVIYTRLGQWTDCTECLGRIVALRADSTEAWPPFELEGGPGTGLVQGPNGDIFSVFGAKVVGLNRFTGEQSHCQPSAQGLSRLVGSYEGVFASRLESGIYAEIVSFKDLCEPKLVFSSDKHLFPGLVVAKKIITIEYGLDLQTALLGVQTDGTAVWRSAEIAPDFFDGGTAIAGQQSGVIYVLGRSKSDGLHKLFFVESDTGRVFNSVPVGGRCSPANCELAKGIEGAIYLNDRGSTRIFRIQ